MKRDVPAIPALFGASPADSAVIDHFLNTASARGSLNWEGGIIDTISTEEPSRGFSAESYRSGGHLGYCAEGGGGGHLSWWEGLQPPFMSNYPFIGPDL